MSKTIGIRCECGLKVKGSSILHAQANLEIHKLSKIHKRLMESKDGKGKI